MTKQSPLFYEQCNTILFMRESHSVVSGSLKTPGQNTGVGNLPLLLGNFPTQESNLGLPHCRLILYQLSHKGSPFYL